MQKKWGTKYIWIEHLFTVWELKQGGTLTAAINVTQDILPLGAYR